MTGELQRIATLSMQIMKYNNLYYIKRVDQYPWAVLTKEARIDLEAPNVALDDNICATFSWLVFFIENSGSRQ